MGFLVHSGARHDPIGLEGTAHFVEHLVSKNAGVPEKEMREFFESCGGSFNFGSTSYPATRYNFLVPKDRAVLGNALSIFGDMLLSATLIQMVERERGVIMGEFYRRYPIMFRFELDMRGHKALYGGSWLERFARPLGAPESIQRITERDLQTYYDLHYTPPNMSIVSVGGMALPELLELLSESSFAVEKKGVRTPLPEPEKQSAPPLETRHVCELSKYTTTESPSQVGGYQSTAKIPGSASWEAVRIFDGMLHEVLREEVRERRAWTYAIGSSCTHVRSFYEFMINCSALKPVALDGIENVVEACIASIGTREDLFLHTKQHLLRRNFMIDPGGADVCDNALRDLTTHQRIISLAEIGDDLECITMGDVRNLLQWLRPEQRWTLITRP